MALYTVCVVTYSLFSLKNMQSKSTHYLTIRNENLLQPAFLTHAVILNSKFEQ